MNAIETIRAEIERRIKELPECSTKTTAGSAAIRHRRIYEALLAFINQLPAQPVPSDVQEAADKYIGHPYEVDEGVEVSMQRDAYAAGMLAERERLMNGALCGNVDMCGVSAWVELPTKVLTDYLRSNFKEGDEVRVIIVKNEE